MEFLPGIVVFKDKFRDFFRVGIVVHHLVGKIDKLVAVETTIIEDKVLNELVGRAIIAECHGVVKDIIP